MPRKGRLKLSVVGSKKDNKHKNNNKSKNKSKNKNRNKSKSKGKKDNVITTNNNNNENNNTNNNTNKIKNENNNSESNIFTKRYADSIQKSIKDVSKLNKEKRENNDKFNWNSWIMEDNANVSQLQQSNNFSSNNS